jgi:plastocyanin
MKRILTALFATAVIVGTMAVGAIAHGPSTATLTIRHQMRGCHTWAVAGGRSAPTQRLTLEEGSTLRVVNNDVMPHRFAQTRGAHLQIVHARMSHVGARATVRFNERGVYKFTTKPGEDYAGFQNMRTVGDDYTLRLTVTVH